MLVAQLSRFGRADEVIELVEQPDPGAPGAGEVLIEAELFPVDPADQENLAGNYGATPPALPMVAGTEGVGLVAMVGPGVTHLDAAAVVDEAHQVIVATELTNCAADSQSLVAMTEQVTANTGRAPKQLLADAGYCSQANLEGAAELTEQTGTEFLIATGRLGHDEPVPAAPRGRIPNGLTAKQRMARKLRTKPGRAGYARRKAIVEPVFGQIATLQGKHVLLRGLDNAGGEWKLLAACHNLRKLHGHLGVAGLGSLRPAI